MEIDIEVRLVGFEGDRKDALHELRNLTGTSVRELASAVDTLPAVVFRGSIDAGYALIQRASWSLDLQLWLDGKRAKSMEPVHRSCPHVARRARANIAGCL